MWAVILFFGAILAHELAAEFNLIFRHRRKYGRPVNRWPFHHRQEAPAVAEPTPQEKAQAIHTLRAMAEAVREEPAPAVDAQCEAVGRMITNYRQEREEQFRRLDALVDAETKRQVLAAYTRGTQ